MAMVQKGDQQKQTEKKKHQLGFIRVTWTKMQKVKLSYKVGPYQL